tara:strand:- start:1155 stop:1655 length:501 start_codon:yes stop_codon:yes gene_type:complete
MPVLLKNGRGQLGEILKKNIKTTNFDEEVVIYHTWNIDDKSEDIQHKEYQKFTTFVKEYRDKRIIFISTKSKKDDFYIKYKQMAESFLIQNCNNCLVLKFPTLIGKGVIKNFKTKKQLPYGVMEIMSLKKCSSLIIDNINFQGQRKILYFDGETVSADLVYELVNI